MPMDSRSLRNRAVNLIGLQTPPARLFVVLGGSLFLLIIPYNLLVSMPSVSLFSNTGINSPSIGLTRAYWLLLHTRISDAWAMNPLIFLAIIPITYIATSDTRLIVKSYRARKGTTEAIKKKPRIM